MGRLGMEVPSTTNPFSLSNADLTNVVLKRNFSYLKNQTRAVLQLFKLMWFAL